MTTEARPSETVIEVGSRYLLEREERELFPDILQVKSIEGDRVRGRLYSSGMMTSPAKEDHEVGAEKLGDSLSGGGWIGATEDVPKFLEAAGCEKNPDGPGYRVFSNATMSPDGEEIVLKGSDICLTADGWRALVNLIPEDEGTRVCVIG